METDHIEQVAVSQDHSIANAIPVCFDCHAEVHAYNTSHPRGRRFTSDELRMHRDQWLHICETRPEIFVQASRDVDIGPMQGLLDELDHNLVISAGLDYQTLGFLFREEQLTRAIREGILSMLDDELRQTISVAYGAISRANEAVRNYNGQSSHDRAMGMIAPKAFDAVQQSIRFIQAARDRLLGFLRTDLHDT